jgi:hypothetical protein
MFPVIAFSLSLILIPLGVNWFRRCRKERMQRWRAVVDLIEAFDSFSDALCDQMFCPFPDEEQREAAAQRFRENSDRTDVALVCACAHLGDSTYDLAVDVGLAFEEISTQFQCAPNAKANEEITWKFTLDTMPDYWQLMRELRWSRVKNSCGYPGSTPRDGYC